MLKIIEKEVDELIPYINNARTHSDEQITQIASSIKEFGFNNPVLLDGENGVVAGHGRLLAAKKLKLKKIPCIELKHLSEMQKKAYILADNKINLNSGWDLELLNNEIKALSEDLQAKTGFSESELSEILNTNCDLVLDEDLEVIENVNEKCSFSIKCGNVAELENVKKCFSTKKKSISYEEFSIIWKR